jgi:integration host factor subunit alpha
MDTAIKLVVQNNILQHPISSDPRTVMTQLSELSDDRIHAGMIPVGQAPRSTVSRVDLVEAVYRKVGLSRAESSRLVELVLQEITDCLDRGEAVKLSSFGSFVVRNKGPRPGRNPKTGSRFRSAPEGR